MKRQARLFALVEVLRSRRTGVTAETLAERFGTSVRTIYRDLETLKEGALPLVAERGRGGGYALDRHYGLPPVNFTAREAAVLLTVGRWATQMRWLPFTETLQSGLEKMRGALSASAQREMIDHLSSLQFVGVPAQASASGVRAAVEQAWFERRPLWLRYRDANGAATERTVRLDGVVLDRQVTYLTCDSDSPSTRRSLRLDRIEKARVVPAGTISGRR